MWLVTHFSVQAFWSHTALHSTQCSSMIDPVALHHSCTSQVIGWDLSDYDGHYVYWISNGVHSTHGSLQHAELNTQSNFDNNESFALQCIHYSQEVAAMQCQANHFVQIKLQTCLCKSCYVYCDLIHIFIHQMIKKSPKCTLCSCLCHLQVQQIYLVMSAAELITAQYVAQ